MPQSRDGLKRIIDQALGEALADLVITNTRLLDVVSGELIHSDIAICGDLIVGTCELGYQGRRVIDGTGLVAVPGFIDTHVHPESTLVLPGEFDRLVITRGTTTAIADPHEIANVLGLAGLRFYIDCAMALVMDMRINLASCVPASPMETSGARLEVDDLLSLRGLDQVLGLAEMMNYPGLLAKDDRVLDKIVAFQGGMMDGHAPLLGGRRLNAYLSCGIRNCHESTSLPEAEEKLRKGMQVLIRDGSVTRDVARLAPLIDPMRSPFLCFCTDDRTPLHIAEDGHIDHLIRLAIAAGQEPASVYRAASWSAANAFGLSDRGIIAPGRRADIVLLRDYERCMVDTVICAGRPVDDNAFESRRLPAPIGYHSIRLAAVAASDMQTPCAGGAGPVIGLLPGKIVTEFLRLDLPYSDGLRRADPVQDVAKVVVFERYGKDGSIGRGFVRGFGLREGAMASSIGHDAHNIIVVGYDDEDMALAVNRLIALQGGFVVACARQVQAELALPVAGLMSDRPATEVEQALRLLRYTVRSLGCTLDEPFVQLAFLPLSVIPHLKITNRGLVDVDSFTLLRLDD